MNKFTFDNINEDEIFNEDLWKLLENEEKEEKKTIIKFPKKRKKINVSKINFIKEEFICDFCSKEFSGPSGLWYHYNKSKTNCNVQYVSKKKKIK